MLGLGVVCEREKRFQSSLPIWSDVSSLIFDFPADTSSLPRTRTTLRCIEFHLQLTRAGETQAPAEVSDLQKAGAASSGGLSFLQRALPAD